MKNPIIYLFLLIILFSCSSDSDGSGDEPACAGQTFLLSVVQNGEEFIIDFYDLDAQNFNFYEIGFGSTSSLANQQQLFFNNTFTTTESTPIVHEFQSNFNYLAEENESLSFYIRAQCRSGAFTEWRGPIVVDIEYYCPKPDDLRTSGSGVYWDDPTSSETNPSYYQVEYGLQGFTLGSGTQNLVNGESFTEAVMAQGNVYDFYVRTFCDSGIGFGNWEGPVSLFAEQDNNLCSPPSNVVHQIEYNFFGDPVGVVFQWDFNGESNFEHVLISDGANPDNATTINTSDGSGWPVYSQGLFLNTPYDFYIRAVCVDGTRTEWVGPRNVVIN